MEKQKTRYKVIVVFDGDADAIDVFTDVIAFKRKHADGRTVTPPRRDIRRAHAKPNRKSKDDHFVKSGHLIDAGTVMDYNKDAVRHGQTHASGLCG